MGNAATETKKRHISECKNSTVTLFARDTFLYCAAVCTVVQNDANGKQSLVEEHEPQLVHGVRPYIALMFVDCVLNMALFAVGC